MMERDAKRMRGKLPFVFTNLKDGIGVNEVVAFIEHEGMLVLENSDLQTTNGAAAQSQRRSSTGSIEMRSKVPWKTVGAVGGVTAA